MSFQNRFIAYFDYLGFKDFIEKNDPEYQKQIIGNNFRDIENALGLGKTKDGSRGGYIADISGSGINCINFSDTIIFWTNDDTDRSLHEILQVTHRFNWQAIDYFFPVRGCFLYGHLEYIEFRQDNEGGGVYNINSVYGKGLVAAHLKANQQDWAGTVIDNSIIDELNRRGLAPDEYLKDYAKKYKVPYKDQSDFPEEYVFSIIKGSLNAESLKNFTNGIIENFSAHNKSIDSASVKRKLENTIEFLKTFYNEGDEK